MGIWPDKKILENPLDNSIYQFAQEEDFVKPIKDDSLLLVIYTYEEWQGGYYEPSESLGLYATSIKVNSIWLFLN